MDDSRLKEFFLGDIPLKLVAFWFSLLGYVGAIVTIEIMASKTDSILISAAAKISYVFVYLWLQFKINHAIWWAFPHYKPSEDGIESTAAYNRLWTGGKWSVIICVLLYLLVNHVVNAFLKA